MNPYHHITDFPNLPKSYRRPSVESRWRTVLVIVFVLVAGMVWLLSGMPT